MGTYHDVVVQDLARYSRSVTDLYRLVDGSQRMSKEAAAAKHAKIAIDDEVIVRMNVMQLALHVYQDIWLTRTMNWSKHLILALYYNQDLRSKCLL